MLTIHYQRNNPLFCTFSTTCFNLRGSSSGAMDYMYTIINLQHYISLAYNLLSNWPLILVMYVKYNHNTS
jgi:hypothetical protein